jgi:phosphoglycerate dehydrogenase-like enzyme
MPGVDERPLILVDPQPRTLDMICDPPTRARLEALGRLVVSDAAPMPDEQVDALLPEAVAVLGQTDLPAGRLARAPRLRAIVNVEGNFLPNVDYAAARARGVHVLCASPAFAVPVAEAALGMAIDLARGIGAADRAMRAGRESWGLDSNAGAFLLSGSPVGIVGFGDLGRALRRMLAPLGCPVRVYDPWLPELAIRREGAEPAGLDELLAASRVVFVFAAATSDNAQFLGERELRLIPAGGVLLLMSRAGVVDFDALVRVVQEGRLRAAVDVFPEEPLPAGHPARSLDRLLLSPHRTGGMPEAFLEIGRLAVADLELVLRGLPPSVCKRAEAETVGRLRSRPVARS